MYSTRCTRYTLQLPFLLGPRMHSSLQVSDDWQVNLPPDCGESEAARAMWWWWG